MGRWVEIDSYKTPKRTKRQMYQRDVRSAGHRLNGYIKTPKRTKRQMYKRDARYRRRPSDRVY